MSVGEWLRIEQVILEAKRSGRSAGRELATGGWILSRRVRQDIEAAALADYAKALEAMSVRDLKVNGREALTAVDMKAAVVQFLRDAARHERER